MHNTASGIKQIGIIQLLLSNSQTIENQMEMVKRIKDYKAGFVKSDANIRPDQTLADLLSIKERTGHSTTAGRQIGRASCRERV